MPSADLSRQAADLNLHKPLLLWFIKYLVSFGWYQTCFSLSLLLLLLPLALSLLLRTKRSFHKRSQPLADKKRLQVGLASPESLPDNKHTSITTLMALLLTWWSCSSPPSPFKPAACCEGWLVYFINSCGTGLPTILVQHLLGFQSFAWPRCRLDLCSVLCCTCVHDP